MAYRAATLLCDDMTGSETRACERPVTHIDRKGYVYCTECGLERRQYMPCRKLRPYEIKRLLAGEPLASY